MGAFFCRFLGGLCEWEGVYIRYVVLRWDPTLPDDSTKGLATGRRVARYILVSPSSELFIFGSNTEEGGMGIKPWLVPRAVQVKLNSGTTPTALHGRYGRYHHGKCQGMMSGSNPVPAMSMAREGKTVKIWP